MQIKRTVAADEDLIDIYLYGSQNFGQSKAESYYAEINQTFIFLADNPLASPERFEFEPPVRIHAHGKQSNRDTTRYLKSLSAPILVFCSIADKQHQKVLHWIFSSTCT